MYEKPIRYLGTNIQRILIRLIQRHGDNIKGIYVCPKENCDGYTSVSIRQ